MLDARRRCSGVSIKKGPASDQKASLPKLGSASWSTTITLARVGQLARGDQTGQAASNDDRVGVTAQSRLPSDSGRLT